MIAVAIALFQAAGPALDAVAWQEAVIRVGTIEIVVSEVFDAQRASTSWPYRIANKLHVLTRESVVRQELLFASGDVYDPEAVAQTERNLRALAFFRDARVETTRVAGEAGSAVMNVRVNTWDAWSTVPELTFAKVGNRYIWEAGISEKNLLGRGKHVAVTTGSGIDRDVTRLLFEDPRVAGSRFQLRTQYANQDDGNSSFLEVERPYFSIQSAWSGSVKIAGFDQLAPIYEAGERVSNLRHVRRAYGLEISRAVSRRSASAFRLHTAYRFLEDEVAGALRSFGIFEVGVSTIQHKFLTLTHINHFERAEDFNLGLELRASIGVSTRWLGGEPGTVFFFGVHHQRSVRFGAEQFLTASLSWNARHRGQRIENSLAEVKLNYLNKLSGRKTLVAAAELDYGTRLDPEVQVTLGADNGLRGFPVRQWVGDRSLRISIEQRWFIVDDFLQVASLGIAAFTDSGYAWPTGRRMDLSDLRTNVGVGLLVGRNRLSTAHPSFRLDIAYTFEPVEGRSRWLLSAGSEIEI